MFYPIVKETAGTWGDMAIELVQESGRLTTVITQDTRETVILFQRLSKRGNAECGLLPQHNEHRIKESLQPLFNILLSFHARGFVLVGKKNKNLCSRDGRTICGLQCVP